MKRTITLLAAGMFLSIGSFAQWGNDHHHDRDDRDQNRYGGYNNDQYRVFNFRTEDELLRDLSLSRQQERKINRINQQFQQAVSRIQYDRFSNSQQRTWQMERLEQQRRTDIMNLLSGYQRDRYNAWCTRNTNQRSTYGNTYPNSGRRW